MHSTTSVEEMRQVARSAYVPVLVKTGPRFRSRLAQRELGEAAAITDAPRRTAVGLPLARAGGHPSRTT